MSIYEVFTRNVKKILDDNELSQADLARALNQTPQQVNNTMSLRNQPSLDTVAAYADALGVTVSQILSDKSPKLVKIKKTEITIESAIDKVADDLKKLFKTVNNHEWNFEIELSDLESRIRSLEKKI
jgi:transcriptional regulator with XRE-family HTH domain